MKHAARAARAGRAYAVQLLGPLTIGRGQNQLMGASNPTWWDPGARIAAAGSRHVLVVSGIDGRDEISVTGETGRELKDTIREYTSSRQFGMQPASCRFQVRRR